MNNITMEEFFKCNKTVQRKLLKWKRYNWNKGDMFTIWENLDIGFIIDILKPVKRTYEYESNIRYYSVLNHNSDEIYNSANSYMYYIPLLTVNDLIKYLEFTNKCKLNIIFHRNNYEIKVSNKYYKNLGNSLLYALWKVVNVD